MEIVIDIPEKVYNALTHTEFDANLVVDEMRKAIANGTSLPKGHGRLIDADKLELDDGYSNYDGYYHKYSQSQIYNAPTIIEAEGSKSE